MNSRTATSRCAQALLLLLLITAAPSWATNGYFTHGLGPKSKALAGAGSASPGDAVATAINPAAAVVIGDRFEVGIAIFSPRRSYRTTASQLNGEHGAFTINQARIESENKWFPIPFLGKIWQREDAAFALNFYGRGGMNTEFRGGAATFDPDGMGPEPIGRLPGTFGGGTTGVDLSQAFLDVTYARRTGSVSWGVSLILAAQAFEAKGLTQFAAFTEHFARSGGTSLPGNLSDEGSDYSFGYGVKTGIIWAATNSLNLAASYQSETNMQRFDRYSDLFADRGSFDVPANARLGASWKVTGKTTIHFDVDRTFYGDVDAIGNSSSVLVDCPTAGQGGTNAEACLGGRDGAGFGWEDVTTYHFGFETHFATMPRWTWRAGYSWANSPIRSGEVLFNILAPGVIKEHITFGASRSLSSGKEVHASLMYAPGAEKRGVNAFDPTQFIELEMHQFEIEIGLSW